MGIGMVAMVVMVVMTSTHRNRDSIGLTGARAFPFTETAGFRETLNVVMVTGLIEAHLLFKAQHLRPVFTQRAVHGGFTTHHLLNPLQESVENERVIAQIRGVDEFNLRMISRNALGVFADPAHQNPGEEEIRKDDDALEPQLHHMTKTGFNKRKGDA